jgi:CelD/BcsL family acetyltransferase involved in cellulose biosynthesis
MEIAVVSTSELGSAEIAAWHEMQSQTPALASPFLSPEFAIAAGKVRPDARVAVLAERAGPVGFFPFERRRSGAGVPIAAGLTDCQGLVHVPGAQWDPRDLLRACRVGVWHFDHLVAGQQPFARYVSASAASPVIDLTDGYAAYAGRLQARSPQICKDVARKSRKLERELGELRFVPDSRDVGDLRVLMSWKSDQYRRTGRRDRFDQPWIVDLVEELLNTRAGGFSGLLSMLYAADTPIAGHFGLRQGGVLGHWFPAYDASFGKYSPGMTQHLKMIEESAALGIVSIDLGKGAKRYKEQLKSYDLTVAEGTVIGSSVVAAAHRAGHAPARWAVRQIRGHQGLFTAADRVLKRYGRLRVALKAAR